MSITLLKYLINISFLESKKYIQTYNFICYLEKEQTYNTLGP